MINDNKNEAENKNESHISKLKNTAPNIDT